jgi:hypothetical protein
MGESPTMINDTEYSRAVTEFMARKGITRCPTVCVVPTQGNVAEADRAALRDYDAARAAARFAKWRSQQQRFLTS